MIISVWNQEKDGYDSILASLLSVMAVYMYPCRIALMENSNNTSMGDYLLGNTYSQSVREEGIYKTAKKPGTGVADHIAEKYMKNVVDDTFVEVINGGLYYVPQICDRTKESFEEFFRNEFGNILEKAGNQADFILVNTEKNGNYTSCEVLEKAEKIIVMIKGEYESFSAFIENYRSILDKCYFVVFAPDYVNRTDIRKVSTNLGIMKKRMFIMPYTPLFLHYRETGNILDYLRKYINCNRNSSEYRFISRLKICVSELFSDGIIDISYQFRELMEALRRKNYGKKDEYDHM